MPRLPALALLIVAMMASPALATQIYWTPAAPDGLQGAIPGANVRGLVSGTTLVVTPEPLAAPARFKGLQALDVPVGLTPYLVELRDGVAELEGLASVVEVLWTDLRFAIVAQGDDSRVLDVLRTRRERLVYTPPVMAARSAPDLAQTKSVDPSLKVSIVDQVSATRFGQFLREISGDAFMWLNGNLEIVDNRYTHNAEHNVAADYLEDRLETLGLTVVRQNFTVGATPTQNIVAIQTGTTDPDEIIVVGGHYDSTSQDPNNLAPGAEDNGTGTAGVLLLAEIFSQYETEKTIHFVAFGGEEQGLFGSQHYVSQATINGDNVTSALTLDMISYVENNAKVIIEGEAAWLPLMNIYEANLNQYTTLGSRKDLNSFGSDHVPFQNAGIPAFLAIDWDYPFYPDYHRTTDVYENIALTLDQGVGILRAMAGALSDLAVPSEPATAGPPAVATRLLQNSPNPFNPSTVIPFQIGADGPVKMAVYDLAGRHVRTLLDEVRVAGPGEIRWDGRDAAGHTVGSGLYLYRLDVPGHSESRRMVLIK